MRGFRIELGEIESVPAKHSAVKLVVVLAREDERGDKRLLAYVVTGREAGEVKGEELRSYLRQHLPDYMVPQAVITLAKLPHSTYFSRQAPGHVSPAVHTLPKSTRKLLPTTSAPCAPYSRWAHITSEECVKARASPSKWLGY